MSNKLKERPMSPARPAKAAMTPKQLRSLLERKKLTQEEAATKLGYSRNTVVRWLMGMTPINRANAALIEKEIGK